jgi:hypothetical protein
MRTHSTHAATQLIQFADRTAISMREHGELSGSSPLFLQVFLRFTRPRKKITPYSLLCRAYAASQRNNSGHIAPTQPFNCDFRPARVASVVIN